MNFQILVLRVGLIFQKVSSTKEAKKMLEFHGRGVRILLITPDSFISKASKLESNIADLQLMKTSSSHFVVLPIFLFLYFSPLCPNAHDFLELIVVT